MLRAGGSAADAVISTSFCESAVAPHLSGLGGSVSILANTLNDQTFSLNAPSVPAEKYQESIKNLTGEKIYVFIHLYIKWLKKFNFYHLLFICKD